MKYMGSKSRIAKDIVPIIQKCIDDNNIETYIEGGFAKPGYEKTKTGTRYRDYYKEGLNNLLK